MTRRDRQPGRWQWPYDGCNLVAVIEQHADGWHVLIRGRRLLGIYLTREAALAAVNESLLRGRP
jgi:hypothetical protein